MTNSRSHGSTTAPCVQAGGWLPAPAPFGFAFREKARTTGAAWAWRVRSQPGLPRVEEQPAFTPQVHAGLTLVDDVSHYGRPMLVNWTFAQGGDASDGEAFVCRFKVDTHRIKAYDPFEPDTPKWIQSHPDQVVPTHGDSGGPLFAGGQVIGITSSAGGAWLVPEAAPHQGGLLASLRERLARLLPIGRVGCIASVWEPVADHLAWIQGVRKGSAAAWVLEVGTDHFELLMSVRESE